MRSLKKSTLKLVTALAMVLMLIPSMGVAAAPAQKAAPLSAIFDARWYADQNPDVKAVFGYNTKLLQRHFQQYGAREGRNPSMWFDLKAYKAGNPDVAAVYGDNWWGITQHYLQYGIYENANGQRSSAGIAFNPVAYANAYPDVKAVFGNNWAAITQHFLTYGVKEGRTAGVNAAFTVSADGTVTVAASAVSGTSSGSSSSHSSKKSSGGSSSSKPNAPSVGPAIPDDGKTDTNPGTTPGKPGTTDPENPKPVDPDDTHTTHDWSKKDGVCTVCGEKCSEDHDALKAEGGTCSVCGKVVEKEKVPDPTPVDPDPIVPDHTKDSVHTKDDFGDDGLCMKGCGLTVQEFQDACEHAWKNGVCEACGKICEDHDWSGKDGICKICGTECNHVWTEDGEDPTGVCTICGMICPVDHDKVDAGTACPTCGVEGTKTTHDRESVHTKEDFDADTRECTKGCGYTLTEFQAACQEYGDDHAQLHKGVVCEICGTEGEADHTFVNGECTGKNCTETCDEMTCPDGVDGTNKHADLHVGEVCEKCGYEGTVKYTTETCPDKDTVHATLLVNEPCPKCDYVGEKLYTFEDCPNQKADGHASVTDEKCPLCGAVVGGQGGETHDHDNWDEEWSTDADNHWHKCLTAGCEEVNDKAAHEAGDPVVTKKPTETETGLKVTYCKVCNYAMNKEEIPATGEQTTEHVHDWSNQDGTCAGTIGVCDGCPFKENHANLLMTEKCETCGATGTKVDTVVCDNEANHVNLYVGQKCPNCDYVGEKSQAECSKFDGHTDILVGSTCDECGYVGTKEEVAVCENEKNHGSLHEGQKCLSCDVVGTADHVFVNGTCSCGETCTADDCPNSDEHANISSSEKCPTCGTAGTKSETLTPDDEDDEQQVDLTEEQLKNEIADGNITPVEGISDDADANSVITPEQAVVTEEVVTEDEATGLAAEADETEETEEIIEQEEETQAEESEEEETNEVEESESDQAA